MFMSCHHTTGHDNYMKEANKSFKNVAEFKYLVTAVLNQNCIHKDINNRPNVRNAYYHAVQILLSSHQLYKNVNIKVY
jgi:hypothetical protein